MMDKVILLNDIRAFLSKNKSTDSRDMSKLCEPIKPLRDEETEEKIEHEFKELDLVFDRDLLGEYKNHCTANKTPSFSETLLSIIDKKEMKDSDVYKRAGVDRRLFSKIRSNDTYQTSKRTIFSLILAMRLTEKESNVLLESAGFSFSRSQDYDLIILFFVRKAIYDFDLVNYALVEHQLQPLGCIEL